MDIGLNGILLSVPTQFILLFAVFSLFASLYYFRRSRHCRDKAHRIQKKFKCSRGLQEIMLTTKPGEVQSLLDSYLRAIKWYWISGSLCVISAIIMVILPYIF